MSNESARHIGLLRASALFGKLPDDALDLIAPLLRPLTAVAGTQLLTQGERGDELYLIVSGQVSLLDAPGDGPATRLGRLGAGEVVGEIGVLTGEPRTATVVADEAVELLAFNRADLERLGDESPGAQRAMLEALQRRAAISRTNKVLRTTDLFGKLEEPVMSALSDAMELVSLSAGETLLHRGEASDSMYVVISGRVSVVSESDDGIPVREITRGETVGELGLISAQPRAATVRASRDSLLARLSRERYLQLLQDYPLPMVERVIGPAVKTLVTGPDRGRQRTASTFTLAAAAPDVPLAEFAEKLSEALGRIGPTLRLNSAHCDILLDAPGIANRAGDEPEGARLALWLDEQELNHRYVIYEADGEGTTWKRRTLRQADQLLVVGRANPIPVIMPDWLSTTGSAELTKRRLVLLQEPDTSLPAGTAAWLERIPANTHHHVRLGNEDDMARLARLLAGQGIGLVLSGGGARGYAQIGVVRGLLEAGIPLDWVCGVSAGAIIAGQFAMGLDEPAIMARMRAVQRGIDYTLPIHSITTGRNWNDSMRDLFGDARIEDFWISYFCVSANLTEARQEIHDRGSAMIAARSSASFPGLVPPVFHEGNILVDGGLFNNLPVDLMKQKPEIGTVIAVDVGVGRGIKEIRPFEPYASGWTALRQRLLRQKPAAPVPSILEVLGSSFTLTNVRTAMATAGLADLLLQPPVGQFGLTDFSKFEVLSEVGYRYTKEQLESWIEDGTLGRAGLLPYASPG